MKQIFSGIYKSFLDSGGELDVFENKIYLNHIERKLNSHKLVNVRQIGNIPLLTSTLSSSKKTINIVDYGGGAGETFLKINKILGNYNLINYHVVDNQYIISIGEKYFKEYSYNKNISLNFHINNKDNINKLNSPDILQLGSVLQYIENWKIFLHNIFEYKAEYLILEDIYATQIPQFVSLQKFYDKYIPLQFLNFDVLTNFINNNQYEIIHISDCVPFIYGKEEFYEMRNIPKKYRINRTKNIILQKKK